MEVFQQPKHLQCYSFTGSFPLPNGSRRIQQPYKEARSRGRGIRGKSHRLVRDKFDTWGKYRNGTKTAHDERISHSRAQKFKSSEKKEAVLFCWGVIFKALLGSTHKGNWTKCASEKMLLSLTVIATKITIIGPIKVILNEQYVILMFLYLRKGVFLISSDCLAQIHFKCH